MSKNLKSMTLQELGAVLKEMGQPSFRAKQVYTWLHKGGSVVITCLAVPITDPTFAISVTGPFIFIY